MFRVGLVGIVAAFMALFLKKEREVFANLIVIVAGILIFCCSLGKIGEIIEVIKELWSLVPVGDSYLVALFQIMGIMYIAQFSSSVCKDAGYSTLSTQIDLFAKISIVALSFPGLRYLLSLVEKFL